MQMNSSDYYLTRNWGYKGVHTFPNGISRKVNVMARLECELAYFKIAIQYLVLHIDIVRINELRFKIQE